MQFSVGSKALDTEKKAIVAVGLYSGDDGKAPTLTGHAKAVDTLTKGAVKDAYKAHLFSGGKGEVHVMPGWDDTRVLLVGLGKKDKADLETFRLAGAASIKKADALKATRLVTGIHDSAPGKDAPVPACAQAVVEGMVLGRYKFDRFKSKGKDNGNGNGRDDDKGKPTVKDVHFATHEVTETNTVKAHVTRGEAIAEGQCVARDLANSPGNVATPEWLANEAKRIGRDAGLKVTVLGMAEIKKHKMGGLLGVNQGSEKPPRLVVMEHKPRASKGKPYKTVVFVGKGITFDSGGISIKPSQSMELMKYDKCGACAVLGAMSMVGKLNLPIRVIGITAFTENLPSGSAYKPGDILTMANGKTVEVLNTDAEGRLILGDALWYAHRFKPDAIIDLATLTGAIAVALGSHYTGLMGSDDKLVQMLVKAGKESGERMWHMPIGDEYQEMIKGSHADLNNIGGRGGGALTAGQFLHNFVETDKVAWAHMDIAATAWVESDAPYTPKGCTGVGVRALAAFLKDLTES